MESFMRDTLNKCSNQIMGNQQSLEQKIEIPDIWPLMVLRASSWSSPDIKKVKIFVLKTWASTAMPLQTVSVKQNDMLILEKEGSDDQKEHRELPPGVWLVHICRGQSIPSPKYPPSGFSGTYEEGVEEGEEKSRTRIYWSHGFSQKTNVCC